MHPHPMASRLEEPRDSNGGAFPLGEIALDRPAARRQSFI
jgi:hypothetical protein